MINEKINFSIELQIVNQKSKRRILFDANRLHNSNHHPIQFFLQVNAQQFFMPAVIPKRQMGLGDNNKSDGFIVLAISQYLC